MSEVRVRTNLRERGSSSGGGNGGGGNWTLDGRRDKHNRQLAHTAHSSLNDAVLIRRFHTLGASPVDPVHSVVVAMTD